MILLLGSGTKMIFSKNKITKLPVSIYVPKGSFEKYC
ncbi:hypothetical protein DFR56_109175 [Pseudogracilibacillus auburnensis]|uniref:Uncharacterized protein n=1 Tax=Pseudogracilibacillus auburnensis TaxID=1494959 RepID=A0A2V3VVK4_9BACI|nr:hypothetical protein DFR56_109175 [Pseudogracilibacillus auburnensis]